MKKRFCILPGIALLMTACALDGGSLIGPAGGFVFYDKGNYSDNWRYLECAPENAGTGSWEKAKQLCAEYGHGGYDDGWRLPDIDELEKLLGGKHGNIFNNGVYWSSKEDGDTAKGIQNGDNPAPDDISGSSSGKVQAPASYRKNLEYWARPVREF